MKKLMTLMLVVITIFCFTACGATEEEQQITNTAEYEECILVLNDAEIVVDDEGNNIAVVNATYTNNGSDPIYALSTFAVRGFQNDTEITDVSDINGDDASLITEVKEGESIDVTYRFQLVDDSPLEVMVGEPTADETTIGRQVYFESE